MGSLQHHFCLSALPEQNGRPPEDQNADHPIEDRDLDRDAGGRIEEAKHHEDCAGTGEYEWCRPLWQSERQQKRKNVQHPNDMA